MGFVQTFAKVLSLALSIGMRPVERAAQAQDLLKGTPLAGASVELVGRGLKLGLIVGTALAADGSVLLVDRGESRVLRVRPDGTLMATFGGPGDGPGEFRFPYRVAELSDGSVIVYDLAIRRFSEFGPTGKFRRRWSTSVDIATLDDVVPLDKRGFAISGILKDPKAGHSAVHVFDSTFQLVQSFGELPPSKSRVLLEQWGAGSLLTTSNGNLLFTRRIPYELYWFTPRGERQRFIKVPRPVSEAADVGFLVRSDGATVTTEVRKDVAYPLSAAPLPGGHILAARMAGQEKFWDLVDEGGRLLWSGKAPTRLNYFIGSDEARNTLWFMGDVEEEPVLYRIRPARNP